MINKNQCYTRGVKPGKITSPTGDNSFCYSSVCYYPLLRCKQVRKNQFLNCGSAGFINLRYTKPSYDGYGFDAFTRPLTQPH